MLVIFTNKRMDFRRLFQLIHFRLQLGNCLSDDNRRLTYVNYTPKKTNIFQNQNDLGMAR
jgi:hypothetical protein